MKTKLLIIALTLGFAHSALGEHIKDLVFSVPQDIKWKSEQRKIEDIEIKTWKAENTRRAILIMAIQVTEEIANDPSSAAKKWRQGFEKKAQKIVERKELKVDGITAHQSRIYAEIQGIKLEFSGYYIIKDTTSYAISIVSPQEDMQARDIETKFVESLSFGTRESNQAGDDNSE